MPPRGGLEVAFGYRPDHLHGVSRGDSVQDLWLRFARADCGTEVIEVPHHRSRQEQVKFPALRISDAKAMRSFGRDEDEATRGAPELFVVHEDDVLAFENVEGLGDAVVDVHRWPEV